MKCVVQDHSLYLQIQKNVFVLEYILSLLINARFHNEETHPQSTKEGFKCKTLQKYECFFYERLCLLGSIFYSKYKTDFVFANKY